jgi:hypothetical protein
LGQKRFAVMPAEPVSLIEADVAIAEGGLPGRSTVA